MKGCMNCVKYTFFFFNFLFWILGAAALAVGIWAAVDSSFETTMQEALTSLEGFDALIMQKAAYLIIVAGAVMMLIGLFGCCGALRESQCCLGVFFASLFVVLGLIVAIIVIIFVKPHAGDDISRKVILDLIKSDKNLDLLQSQLKCCGADGKKDYEEANKDVPQSCEGYVDTGCVHAMHDVLQDIFKEKPHMMGGISAAILLVMVAGMVLSIFICCFIRSSRDETDAFKPV